MSTQVSPGEFKAYARLASSAADGPIRIILAAVESWLAGYLGVSWTRQNVVGERVDGGGDTLYLAVRPVVSIASIVDKFDNSITVDTAEYYAIRRGATREVDAEPQWPWGAGRYLVNYTGGYEAMPDQVKLVVLGLATKYFNARDTRTSEATLGGVAVTWESLMSNDLALLLHGLGCRDFA